MRKINRIIVHCSDSLWGDAAEIDRWHRGRGWKGIGYHFVILNCYPTYDRYSLRNPARMFDGTVERGRPLGETGAHCRGHNTDSIGICLIGKETFTSRQVEALLHLVTVLRGVYGDIPVEPHSKYSKKTCPNLDLGFLS